MRLFTQSFCLALATSFISANSFAQSCYSSVYQNTPAERFIVSEDIATDLRTGLVWQRCVAGQEWNTETKSCDGSAVTKSWKNALEDAPEGWRLPNIKELISILDHSCSYPAINTTIFSLAKEASSTLGNAKLWSSTANRVSNFSMWGDVDTNSWYFNFDLGEPLVGSKNNTYYVRYVKNN